MKVLKQQEVVSHPVLAASGVVQCAAVLCRFVSVVRFTSARFVHVRGEVTDAQHLIKNSTCPCMTDNWL